MAAVNETTDGLLPGHDRLAEQVDVIIAAWNRADTIERAIRSVANEPAVRSVIVVDDTSTDDTAARAESLTASFPKLKVLRQPRNGGPSAARNAGITAGEGTWIAILDGDDYMQPGRLTRLLDQGKDADLVADDLLQIEEDAPTTAVARPLLNIDASWPAVVTLSEFVMGNIGMRGRMRREMGFLKPIMRRAFLQQHGLHYDNQVRLGEDYLLYAEALARGARFRLTAAAGYVAVMRGDSLSGRHTRQDLEALLRGGRRLAALPGLQPGERRALQQHCRHVDGKIRWLVVIEAVKERDMSRFLNAFLASPQIGIGLIGKLLEQVYLRGAQKLRRLMGLTNVG